MKQLTAKEEAIMQILWRKGKAFVKEIMEELDTPKPPITTVSSIVRKLQEEQLVGYESFGRTHRYFPILQKEVYRKSVLHRLMKNYFGGSSEQLLSYFVKEEKMDAEALDEILNKIKNKEEF